MEEKNPNVSGEFFEKIKGCGQPPTLVVDVLSNNQYQLIYDILTKEQFIKVRKVAARYRRLVINTVGEAKDLGDGSVSYSNCRLNITIVIKPPKSQMRVEIDNSPVWSILFVHPRENREKNDHIIFILVDKQTEEIVYRKDVKRNR